MKVKDLIADLQELDPEFQVHIGEGSGSKAVEETETDYASEIVVLWPK